MLFRSFLLLLFIQVTLQANYPETYAYYKAGEYKKAISSAKKSKSEYSNPNLHLLWGYSARALGNQEEAMSAFERVLLLKKDNKSAKKALLKIYKKTDRRELAEKLNGKTNASKISERGSKSGFKTKVSLSTGYDDNVNVTPGNSILNEYYNSTTSQKKLSSYFSRMNAEISYKHHFKNNKDWYLKTIIHAYVQSNFSTHFYDLTSGSLELGIGYMWGDKDIYLPLSYNGINYLNQDLLEQYRFAPTIFMPIHKDIFLDITLLYSKNDYIPKTDDIKDDETFGLAVGTYYLFGKHYVYHNLKYEHRRASHDTPQHYISADFLTASIGAKYYFNSSFLANFDYRFRYGSYDSPVGLSNTSRDDNFYQIDLKLSYLFSKELAFYLNNSYSQNISNFVPSEYEKNSILFGAAYQY